MEKREQDILKKIESKTEEVKVPDKLKPLQIEKMLNDKGKQKLKNRTRIYRFASLAAACMLLVAGIGVYRVTDTWDKTRADSSDENMAAEKSAEENAEENVVESQDDYSEIYAYIEKNQKERAYDEETLYGVTEDSAKTASGEVSDYEMERNAGNAVSATSDYSTTNVRQEGVDEADIVKTDGMYLYVLKENQSEIAVVDTKEQLKKIGNIQMPEGMSVQEFYLLPDEKKLVVVGSVEQGVVEQEETENDELIDVMQGQTGEKTVVITYDISSPEKPKKLGSISQSGAYESSRVVDGYLYLFSNYWIQDDVSKEEPSTYVPMAGNQLIREEDILLPSFERACMYEVVTAVSLECPSEISDSRAIFTNSGALYVSENHIYYYETEYSQNVENTKIRKLGFKEGKFTKAKVGSIKGYINDSFSIDEYQGYLRIVATAGDTNAVYVLDEEMKLAGSIKNLAKDEQIYSARFFGNIGYFVTFRQVDPLFSVDFSEPENPKIIGKLKIPGFSEYLHFYGENKLLGIGMNVEEDTGITDGVKLSMFDLSDKTDVKEEQNYIMKNVYDADVSYDYKAALIDEEKNLIGFSASTEGGEKYYVFSYDETQGFQCKMEEEVNGNSIWGSRGVYIGETLYVIRGNVIEAYSLKNFKKTDDFIL